MKTFLAALVTTVLVLLCVDSLQADVQLFARYDWQDEATDVSGSPGKHDGTVEAEASVDDGKLHVSSWHGVELGYLPELDGATEVLLRFEDVTLPEGGGYCVFAGGGYHAWWVGVYYRGTGEGTETVLKLNVGGWSSWDGFAYETDVVVAKNIVTHFDRIEYRFDGSAPPQERCSIRWNDGPWTTGGWSDAEHFRTFPSEGLVRINDGARADWDPMEGTLGPVSFYSDQSERTGLHYPADCNADGFLDLADATCLLGNLFLGVPARLPCGDGRMEDQGNAILLDSNGDGEVDVTDAVHVLGFLFLGTAPPILGTECMSIMGCPGQCDA